jgi:hypothetical protein
VTGFHGTVQKTETWLLPGPPGTQCFLRSGRTRLLSLKGHRQYMNFNENWMFRGKFCWL